MNWGHVLRLAREMGWVVIGQLAAVVGTLVVVRVLTEHLPPEIYGELALGLTMAGLINQVILGGVITSIGRYYSIAAENQELGAYFRASKAMLRVSTLVVLGLGGLFLVGLYFFGRTSQAGLFGALIVFSLLGGYGAVFSGMLNAARLRSLVALHGGLEAWLKILLVLASMALMGASVLVVVSSYILSGMIVAGSLYYFLKSRMSLDAGADQLLRSWMQRMWTYSLPFASWGLFVWAQQSSDRWALDVFGSREDVGRYAVLFQLGYTPIVMVVGMAVSFLGPILYQRAGDATDDRRRASVQALTWKVTLACLGLTMLGFLFALCLHDWIFALLVSGEYRLISYLMPWMVLAGGLFAAGQMLALRLISDMQASAMTSAKIWTALLGVASNFYAGSVAGVPGVVGAMVFVSGVYLMWMFWLMKNSSPSGHA